jgi:hypothetical protein
MSDPQYSDSDLGNDSTQSSACMRHGGSPRGPPFRRNRRLGCGDGAFSVVAIVLVIAFSWSSIVPRNAGPPPPAFRLARSTGPTASIPRRDRGDPEKRRESGKE